MAAFSIQASHGSDKHHLELSGPQATVTELKLLLLEVTEIPIDSQKVIFKGKTLNDGSVAVGELGMKQGSKIIVLGRKYSPELQPSVQLLNDISKAVDAVEAKMANIKEELEGMEKGFLPADRVPEACRGLLKRGKGCTELLMQSLERLDAVDVPASETLIRGKRRSAIVRIQSLLGRTDELVKRIEECRTSTSTS